MPLALELDDLRRDFPAQRGECSTVRRNKGLIVWGVRQVHGT